MQNGPDGKLNRIVGAPVDSELDLLLSAASRAGQGQPGERLGAYAIAVTRRFCQDREPLLIALGLSRKPQQRPQPLQDPFIQVA